MKGKFQEYREIHKKLMDEVRQNGKQFFEQDVKDFMEANPEVLAFHFHGYTPGFNDGDPCEHRLCGPYLVFYSDFLPAYVKHLAGSKRVCSKDSVTNDVDATFCKKCGAQLDAPSVSTSGVVSWEVFEEVLSKNDKYEGALAKESHDLKYKAKEKDKSRNDAMAQFLDAMDSEQLLEHIYGTNYQVTALRTPTGIDIRGEFYDCGY